MSQGQGQRGFQGAMISKAKPHGGVKEAPATRRHSELTAAPTSTNTADHHPHSAATLDTGKPGHVPCGPKALRLFPALSRWPQLSPLPAPTGKRVLVHCRQIPGLVHVAA